MIVPASEGLLTILTDVLVDRSDADALVAISREPGVVGERVSLQIVDGPAMPRRWTRVAESRPVMMDGSIRHRLRLEPHE